MVGIFTIFIAGLSAMFECDIKKIIALSTLSQLGIIIIILGVNFPLLSFFHLISHAYFKAILFMCAGIIIHNMNDYQDIRNMGNCFINIPLSSRIMLIANLRLCGLPFLRGFYSKDLILEILIISNINLFLFLVVILSTILTVLYSCRLRFLLCNIPLYFNPYFANNDNDFYIHMGMLMLIPFSIFGGMRLNFILLFKNPIIFIPS